MRFNKTSILGILLTLALLPALAFAWPQAGGSEQRAFARIDLTSNTLTAGSRSQAQFDEHAYSPAGVVVANGVAFLASANGHLKALGLPVLVHNYAAREMGVCPCQ